MRPGMKRSFSEGVNSGSFSSRGGRGGGRGFRGGRMPGRGVPPPSPSFDEANLSSRPRFEGRGRGRDAGERPFRGSSSFAGGYRPQVADEAIPQRGENLRGGRGRGAFFSSPATPSSSSFTSRRVPQHSTAPVPSSSPSAAAVRPRRTGPKPRDVVVILEKAGLLLGNMGLVDAYDRAATTEIANPSLQDVRPDIVHQCLLALFDSDLAYQHRLRVYINLFAKTGKVIEVSPALRPPRTFGRFRGLMAALLREGRVCSVDGKVLMRMMPGSIAPIIPHGAEVVGLTNAVSSPVVTAVKLAQHAAAHPIEDSLQGGIKNITAMYCISCTDDCNMEGIDYVSKMVCLSAYPMGPHVQCARVCEAHTHVEPEVGGEAQSTLQPVDTEA